MFSLSQFKNQNSQAYPLIPWRQLQSVSKSVSTQASTPPRKIQRVHIATQTQGLSPLTSEPKDKEKEQQSGTSVPILFVHHPESMRLSTTSVRQKQTKTSHSRPQFVVSKATINQQLQKMICEDTGGFSQQMFTLPCGHNRSDLTTPGGKSLRKRGARHAPKSVRCASLHCQKNFPGRDTRETTFDVRLRELIDKIFSPQPEPPHFSNDEASALFESVCQRITTSLRPPATGCREVETAKNRIQSATDAAFTMITGIPCGRRATPEPEPAPVPPESEPGPAPKPAKERRVRANPFTVSIETKHYSQSLPNTIGADGRLTLIYLIHKHQEHYHTDGQLRFVEHLPNTLEGRKLADDLVEATNRGVRLLSSRDNRGRLTVNWNPALPPHTDRNRPFPNGGVERLQRALEKAG